MAQSRNSTLPLSPEDLAFLNPYLPPHGISNSAPHNPSDRPFVTLTYACSLDGMISLGPGLRTTLSGQETKSVTHYLRLHHDAILVGVGTAIADSPSLNCRYPGAGLEDQPRPVVVDPSARWEAVDTPVVKLAEEGRAKAPFVVSREGAGGREIDDVHRLKVQSSLDHIPWQNILRVLSEQGIRSVMIEGGATVIEALLSEPDLVDAVIVTIAPTWLGQGGVAASPAGVTRDGRRVNAASMAETQWRQFGADAVVCGKLKP